MKKKKLFWSSIFVWLFILGIYIMPCMVQGAAKNVTWTVTQHLHNDDRSQGMFYTIKSSTGKVIAIDGGWSADHQRVRNTIWSLGGTVDVWIITHPHPDHVGAFNRIVQSPQGIKIRRIYAPKIDAARYNKYKQYWDGYGEFLTFQNLMKTNRKVRWIKPGDKTSLHGLKIEFFHSYRNSLSYTTKDICNGSSLVFKLSGKKRSMLFTGDIPVQTGKLLIKKYGKRLRATYLQAPHHGNNSGRYSFFKYLKPKLTFVDAPAVLRNQPNVAKNINYLKKIKSKVYTYNTKRSVIIQ